MARETLDDVLLGTFACRAQALEVGGEGVQGGAQAVGT